jgi:hypothetical protein
LSADSGAENGLKGDCQIQSCREGDESWTKIWGWERMTHVNIGKEITLGSWIDSRKALRWEHAVLFKE